MIPHERLKKYNLPVHDLIHENALCSPDSVALRQKNRIMTYAELDAISNAFALRLQQDGVFTESPVVVVGERSIETIIAFLSVLKAGGTYVPVDKDMPEERVAFIIKDCNAFHVIGIGPYFSFSEKINKITYYDLNNIQHYKKPINDFFASHDIEANHRAYVIYTSGSTGIPKGVEIEHHSLSNLVEFYRQRLELGARDRIPVTASISFDMSVAQIWSGLCCGAAVYLPEKELLLNPPGFVKWLASCGITIVDTPTTLGEVLFKEKWPENIDLRFLLTGGATLRRRPPKDLPFTIINCYGPTENTIDSIWSVVEPVEAKELERPTIGFPITNVYAYIVDEKFKPVKKGEAGELLLGGEQVARGYLNRPEQTKRYFVANPFFEPSGCGRLYRTGDRVKLHANGKMVFLGRIDDQVQLRGYRIELGEIENTLLRHPKVKACVVAAKPETGAAEELNAYVIGISQERANTELPELLKKYLPKYMLPATYTSLLEFPKNLAGKVDKNALPSPYGKPSIPISNVAPENKAGMDIPDSELTLKLVKIWQTLLAVKDISIDDDVFDLGADSLTLINFIVWAQRELGVEIPPNTLLNNPTINLIKQWYKKQTESSFPPCVVTLVDSDSKTPVFCITGAGGGIETIRPLKPYLDPERPFYLLDFLGLDDDLNAHGTVQDITEKFLQAIKAVQPNGPYIIGGYSLGAIFAWELAHQLQNQDEDIRFLFSWDYYGPDSQLIFHKKLYHYLKNIVSLSWPDKVDFFLNKYRWIKKVIGDKFLPAEIRGQKSRFKEVIKAHVRSVENYRFPVRESELDVFLAEKSPLSISAEVQKAGWISVNTGITHIHYVPGNHKSMLVPPNSFVLLEKFNHGIAESRSRLN